MNNKFKIFILVLFIIIISLIAFIITAEIAAAPKNKVGLTFIKNIAENKLPANSLPEAPTNSKITTLIFGGDVMLSRVVNQKMTKYQDFTWPFKNIATELSSADLTIINLESPFTIGGNHTVNTGSFSFNADPNSIAGLKLAGIDVASLANNHLINQGVKGISDTKKILLDNNIDSVGAGLNSAEAHQPIIRQVGNVKFGFLSYAYPKDNSIATSKRPGIAGLELNELTEDIKKLKDQKAIVIILMHAGTEYVNQPNTQQTEFARSAIDAGADLVVGHHPHWVQTTEIYKNKPIIYSLGNLIFDQMWSTETTEGALAKITFGDQAIKKIEFIPITISDYGQATISTSTSVKERILNRMGLTNSSIDF